ncbi:MAG: UPF0280 family protein [Burkholderiaceae bacterium]|nr:UPF0280 family protein [Burkholderiaceae bacterium]
MNAGAAWARFGDGRWHFQHGPIDLVIGVDGDAAAVGLALASAWARFAGVLDELVGELALLRAPCAPAARGDAPRGPIARRMAEACRPYAERFGLFVTPMAAVAGSVAQEIVAHFARPGIRRAWVNNGGDIALWLADGASVDVGMVTDLAAPSIDGRLRIADTDAPRGIATSGWRGRSFSLGVADAVTVLADTAAMADAAATMIANAVDIDHPAVQRAPASSLRDDSDLGERLVTVSVGALPADAVADALGRGERFARRCIDLGLVSQAMLSLQGRSRIVADHRIEALA